MELSVLNDKGVSSGDGISVSDSIFNCRLNESLVHQVLLCYQANGHQRTKLIKNRSMVKASNKKPWRQKGTGRARAGSKGSLLWRGGGNFASHPGHQKRLLKVNKAMYRKAIAVILSQLIRENRLLVIASWEADSLKTAHIVAKLKPFQSGYVYLVTTAVSRYLYLSTRNLYYVETSDVSGLNPISLLRADTLLITRDAITQIEEWLKR